MPLIIRNRQDRATLQLAHASAMRSTNEIIDQLQAAGEAATGSIKGRARTARF
jgi:hypothetical protein